MFDEILRQDFVIFVPFLWMIWAWVLSGPICWIRGTFSKQCGLVEICKISTVIGDMKPVEGNMAIDLVYCVSTELFTVSVCTSVLTPPSDT